MTLFDFIKGVIGRAKVASGVDRTPPDRYEARLGLCSICPALTGEGRCMDCGCPVRLKALVNGERCPRGLW